VPISSTSGESARNSGSITMDRASALLASSQKAGGGRNSNEEHKDGTGPYYGGMNRRADGERIDRLGKEIKSKRER